MDESREMCIRDSHLSPYLGAMRYRQNQDFHQNIFQDLLQKQNIPAPVLEERLHWQLGYMKWKPEDLFLSLIHIDVYKRQV